MFLQVEVTAEPFAAHVARERFLVVVRVHVKRQVVHLCTENENRFVFATETRHVNDYEHVSTSRVAFFPPIYFVKIRCPVIPLPYWKFSEMVLKSID